MWYRKSGSVSLQMAQKTGKVQPMPSTMRPGQASTAQKRRFSSEIPFFDIFLIQNHADRPDDCGV
jgi:hypothetical protein